MAFDADLAQRVREGLLAVSGALPDEKRMLAVQGGDHSKHMLELTKSGAFDVARQVNTNRKRRGYGTI